MQLSVLRIFRCLLLGSFFFLLLSHGAHARETSSFAKALAAFHDRDLDRALVLAKEAVREDPRHADAHVLLGELYYLRQELPKAKEAWERALKLAPSRQDVRQRLEKLTKEFPLERHLARSDTHPFVVRFSEGMTPVDLGALREILRETYRKVGQAFNYFPDHPIAVILYQETDFETVKSLSHQVAGLYDGKIRLPVGKTSHRSGISASRYLEKILWHEYTHALVHDLAKGRCPTWFNEGIATLQEDRVFRVDLSLVRTAHSQGRLVSWSALWQQQYEKDTLELCYQESYLIAKYLVKRWSYKGIVGVLTRLGQGYPIRDALRAEYGEDPVLIEKEWLSWLKHNL